MHQLGKGDIILSVQHLGAERLSATATLKLATSTSSCLLQPVPCQKHPFIQQDSLFLAAQIRKLLLPSPQQSLDLQDVVVYHASYLHASYMLVTYRLVTC